MPKTPKALFARARPPLRASSRDFHAMSLINILLGLFGRRRAPATPLRHVPQDPDWDRENPMSGLS